MSAIEHSTELVPHGMDRLQRKPVIDRIDARTLDLIRKQVAPNCTNAEVGHFLELAAHYDLDPFAKEVWCAKNRDGSRLLIMVGRDGLRKIAQRQGLRIDGDVVRAEDTYEVEFIDRPTDAQGAEWEANGAAPFHRVTHKRSGMGDSRGAIIGAWCRVKDESGRERGWFEAPLKEYKPTDAKRLQYSPWGSQESVMILAAAERQALRQATPLSGLLAEGEDARIADAVTVEPEPVELAEELVDEDTLQGLSTALEGASLPDSWLRMALVSVGLEDVPEHVDEDALRCLTPAQASEFLSMLNAEVDRIADA